jgi:hypothetical protein
MKFKEKKTFGVIRLMSIEPYRLRLTVLRPNTQGCDLCWALLHSAQSYRADRHCGECINMDGGCMKTVFVRLDPIYSIIPSLIIDWTFFRYVAIWVLFSAMTMGCATTPPILTLVDHGSGMDPNISPAPDFRIELFEDGKLHYHGIKSVNVIGDRYGQITPDQVQKMVDLYKRLYKKKQKRLDDFYHRYEKRFTIDPMKRIELEEYKRRYLDWREWEEYMLYHDNNETSRLGPIGSNSSELLGILNQMINLESWVCYSNPDPRHKAYPVLKASLNYQDYLKSLENMK